MTIEEKELLEFAKAQRFANGSNDESDVLDVFGAESAQEEPAGLHKFDDETRIFLIEGIAAVAKPLIEEINRLTNLGKSEKEVEAEKEKSENEIELTDFARIQAEINEVE